MLTKRYADARIGNRTFEFQHSVNNKDEVNKRSDDHKTAGFQINWIIDCNKYNDNDRIKIKSSYKGEYLIEFIDEWIYVNFIDLEYIYLDYGNKIFKITNNLACAEDSYHIFWSNSFKHHFEMGQ